MAVEVVAEIGINHDGDVHKARVLIDQAADAGANTVKFQLFNPDLLVAPDNPLHDILRRTHLSFDVLMQLRDHCRHRGVDFLCTPFDMRSVRNLREAGIQRIKVSSADLTDGPLLYAIGAWRPETAIVSTGMATETNVRAALGAFVLGYEQRDLIEATRTQSIWRIVGEALARDEARALIAKRVVLMQCTSCYPADVVAANLRVMDMYRDVFGTRVGFSDHTPSVVLPALAVARGAVIVEKHLTYDRTASGPDHAASLEQPAFADMVRHVREAEDALGTSNKDLTPGERTTRSQYAKTLVASRAIRKGAIFAEDDLARRRPIGDGLSPFMYWHMVGKQACHDYDAGDMI